MLTIFSTKSLTQRKNAKNSSQKRSGIYIIRGYILSRLALLISLNWFSCIGLPASPSTRNHKLRTRLRTISASARKARKPKSAQKVGKTGLFYKLCTSINLLYPEEEKAQLLLLMWIYDFYRLFRIS